MTTRDTAMPEAEESEAVADVAEQRVPTRFTLATPTDWYRIPLVPEDARERSVRALVDRTFPSRDEHAENRQEMRELFRNIAEDGARRDGVELYISTQSVLGVPLPASLLVAVVPPEDDDRRLHPHWLAAAMAEERPDTEVAVVRLPAGEVVRQRRLASGREVVDLGVPEGHRVTALDFYVPVPGSTAYLLLTFSTPVPELADAMVELFDAVARSLTWSYE